MRFKNEELKNKSGIYAIVNHINGKAYIGQTKQKFYKRFLHHQWKLRDGSHDNKHLQNAWNKYGEESFEFTPLEVINDESCLDQLEIAYIKYYQENNKSYNINEGGDHSRRGIPLTEDQKRKIGEKNRINMLGRKHTDETKRKMSDVRKGKINLNNKTLKLTPEMAFTIKEKLIHGYSASDISKDLEVDYKHINNIIANNAWKSIYVDGWEEYLINRKTYKRLSKEDHNKICKLHFDEKCSVEDLAKMYKRTPSMIRRIIRENLQLYDNPVPSLT